jgi:hypothetical protein
LKQYTVEEYTNRFLNHFNLTVDVFFDSSINQRSYGGYDAMRNLIIIRTNMLENAYFDLCKSGILFRDFEEFFQVVFSHEVGHALDPNIKNSSLMKKDLVENIDNVASFGELDEKINKLSRIIYQCEIIAWNNARKFINPLVDENTLNAYIQNCLASYDAGLLKLKDLVLLKMSKGVG